MRQIKQIRLHGAVKWPGDPSVGWDHCRTIASGLKMTENHFLFMVFFSLKPYRINLVIIINMDRWH